MPKPKNAEYIIPIAKFVEKLQLQNVTFAKTLKKTKCKITEKQFYRTSEKPKAKIAENYDVSIFWLFDVFSD